jgi:hypothetical protein
MADKEDWPPLLGVGEHALDLEDLKSLCVDAFPLSTTRAIIFEKFAEIVRDLRRCSIPAQLVIDGSFLTLEIDPDDIDFALVVSHEFCEALVFNPMIRSYIQKGRGKGEGLYTRVEDGSKIPKETRTEDLKRMKQ